MFAPHVDWVLDGGNITVVDDSLAILLTETNGGTRLSSTRYVHYGTMTVRSKQRSKINSGLRFNVIIHRRSENWSLGGCCHRLYHDE